MKENTLSVGRNETATAVQAHIGVEGILLELSFILGGQRKFVCVEEGRFHQSHHRVSLVCIFCFGIFYNVIEVNGIQRQFGVELAGISIGVLSHEIIQTVCHIAGLLNFGNLHAGANAVYASGRNINAVTGSHIHFAQILFNAAV